MLNTWRKSSGYDGYVYFPIAGNKCGYRNYMFFPEWELVKDPDGKREKEKQLQFSIRVPSQRLPAPPLLVEIEADGRVYEMELPFGNSQGAVEVVRKIGGIGVPPRQMATYQFVSQLGPSPHSTQP